MTNIIPVIGVVYKSKNGNWRGFCYPYDVTCNADTKEEAMEALNGLVETYEESLERHNNPRHLIEKRLTDREDQMVFKKLWPHISKRIAEHLKNAHSPLKYSEHLSGDKKFTVNQSTVSYSHRSLVAV